MYRFLVVNQNTVVDVLQVTIGDIPTASVLGAEYVLPDPVQMYHTGDEFSLERYTGLYTPVVDPVTTAHGEYVANSIFSQTPIFNRDAFIAAGLQVNIHPLIKSPYVYANTDAAEIFTGFTAYGNAHEIKVPDYELCNKSKNPNKFLAAGFTVLATQEVRARADIENFAFDRVMLKPSVACDNRVKAHPLTTALYLIRTKAELLAALDALDAFSNPATFIQNPVVIQQVADGDGDNFDALILSGGINGEGNFWHFSPINLKTQYNDNGRNAKTVWSPENNTDETQQLQTKVELLLNGNTNCFYHLQFLRVGNAWVPHDFQYRMTYYIEAGLERTGNKQHKTDIIKFVFDVSKNTFAQPVSIGLSLTAPHKSVRNKHFVTGIDKAEVLAKLEAL